MQMKRAGTFFCGLLSFWLALLLPVTAQAERLVTSCPVPASAAHVVSSPDETVVENPSFRQKFFGLIGNTFDATLYREPLSRSVEVMSQRLDSFFGSEQLYEEDCNTDSYASVKFTARFEDDG